MNEGTGGSPRSAAVATATTPGIAARLAGVDRADPGVGDGRSDEREMEGAVDREVVDVGGPSGQQVRVLDAADDVSEQ